MKSKTGCSILGWSFLLGAGFWLIHTLLHWRFFYRGSFWDALIIDIPTHDLVVRLFLVVFALVCGWIFYLLRRRYLHLAEEGRRSRQMFHDLFENSPIGMALVDVASRRFVQVNSSMETMLGFDADELTRMTMRDVIVPEDCREEIFQVGGQRRRPGGSHEYQMRCRRKDGKFRWMRVTAEPLGPLHPGRGEAVLVMATDITENLNILERLKQSESRFRVMAETVPLGVEEIDREGRIEWVNPAYCRMFQCTFAEAVGTCIWDHLPDPEPLKKLYDLLMNDETMPMEWVGRNLVGDSSQIDVRVYWDYRRDAEHQVTGAVAVIADVTAEKRTDFHLRQARRLEAVGRLAGGVAHDLNNLLTPILGYSGLMRENPDEPPDRKEAIEAIYQSGMRARDLVRQLLAFGHCQTLAFSVLNLNDVIRGMEMLLRRTIRENVDILYHLSDYPLVIDADSVQLEQVLTNLAVNAQDAMPEGGKLIIETCRVHLDENYIRVHPVVKAGPYALMAVTDSGCGMDEETRERVFDPFYTTKESGGTGLGLATIYGVVKQHNGYIWVYSEPGKGSTFKLYFPLKDAAVPEALQPSGEDSRREYSGSETVAVVEDDTMVRRLAAGMLHRLGYRVITAESGLECLKKCQEMDGAPDLLLADVIMPGMNGSELYKAMKERYADLKVLYMSGYTDHVIVHQGILDTDAVLLQKPFSFDSLAKEVRRILD